MDILYIIPYAPTRVRVRPYSLIRHIAARGHQVALATVYETPAEQAALQDLQSRGIRVLARPLSRARRGVNSLLALPTADPLQSHYSWQPDLARDLAALFARQRFDAVHVEHLRGARYGLFACSQRAASAANRQTPIVWDSVDCITYLFRQTAQRSRSPFGRLMSRLELGRTGRYEGWLVAQFDRVLVTTETDRSQLEQLARQIPRRPSPDAGPDRAGRNIDVLANGVDLDYFTPRDDAPDANTLVFSGKMSYHANITAALFLATEVMPLVWRQRPGARLVIVGSQPAEPVRRLADWSQGRIEVTGYVDDLRPYLWRSCLAVAPLLYGAGIQNKVLEAMACGRPVIATSRAVSPLSAGGVEGCCVADAPQDFAEAIVRLSDNAALRADMGRQGRRYVEQHHNWDHIAARLERVYQAASLR